MKSEHITPKKKASKNGLAKEKDADEIEDGEGEENEECT
jgi:hypothetical protein